MPEKHDTKPSSCASDGVAIIGMSCIFPGAPSIDQFWNNIVSGFDAVREAGESEWDAGWYRNKPSTEFGRIYCPRGGFITEFADFDPIEFGIMPSSIKGSDPDQFLALRAASEALADAGYNHKTFEGDKAEVIIGRTMAPGVGSLNLIQHGQTVDQVLDIVKALAPSLTDADLKSISARLHAGLNPCNADTIPAVMPNLLAGRIACKLGFRGRNLVLDAACASSLVAVEAAIQSLRNGQSDIAIAGGVHINSSPYFYQMFSELGALSKSGVIRPFDDRADGTILGEGVGMVVLKRIEDAVKDGNKIYAVIKGIGSSSDGHGGTALAPNIEGELLAMRRAYEMAGVTPSTIELLEAHGTGTIAGDMAELKALKSLFDLYTHETKEGESRCAIGSVKSMIGHTQAASGIAGLIKTVLALHHKVLPPTLHSDKPNSQVDWKGMPFYLNSGSRPWLQDLQEGESHPRRAAVSAFGFGGINAHAVLEEYRGPLNSVASPGKPPARKNSSMRLSLRYPSIKADALAGFNPSVSNAGQAGKLAETAGAQQVQRPLQVNASTGAAAPDRNSVMRGYFQSVGAFQESLLAVQEKVMRNYLENNAETAVKMSDSDWFSGDK